MKHLLPMACVLAATVLIPGVAEAALSDTIAGRQKIFGIEHVDPKTGYLNQLDLMNMPKDQRPATRWLIDPTDYLKPIMFDTADPIWEDDRKEAMFDQLCKQPGGEAHIH